MVELAGFEPTNLPRMKRTLYQFSYNSTNMVDYAVAQILIQLENVGLIVQHNQKIVSELGFLPQTV